uniref:Uncharacterized protein n=1 Tax=Hydatigena taeniaeformis TaxID=6205 RepID=A0A0R3WLP2_HYDTA
MYKRKARLVDSVRWRSTGSFVWIREYARLTKTASKSSLREILSVLQVPKMRSKSDENTQKDVIITVRYFDGWPSCLVPTYPQFLKCVNFDKTQFPISTFATLMSGVRTVKEHTSSFFI